MDRLVSEPGGVIIAARLQVKGGSFRDLCEGRAASGWGSRLRGISVNLSWPRRRPFGSSSHASALRSFLHIPFGIRPRHSFSTSAEPTCVTCRRFLGTRAWQQRRATRTLIPTVLLAAKTYGSVFYEKLTPSTFGINVAISVHGHRRQTGIGQCRARTRLASPQQGLLCRILRVVAPCVRRPNLA
jgi:hypothetical protein